MRTPALRRPWLHQPPAAFVFVMATGIVAAAMREIEMEPITRALLLVAVVAFVVLLAGFVARIVQTPRAVLADLQDPGTAWGFLTLVAAANVLGSDLYVIWPPATVLLFLLSAPAWVLLAYGIPAWLMLRSEEDEDPDRPPGVDGSWFLWVVSTQSLAVALATLGSDKPRPALLLLAVGLWSTGLVLYLMLTSLALLRLLAGTDRHAGVVPSNWIFMGATAITALAGAVILAAPTTPIGSLVAPVVGGMSFVLWAFGVWWVPLLVLFGAWRHLHNGEPVHYTTGLWSIVFPLGTFSVATLRFSGQEHLPLVQHVGTVAVWVGFAAWLALAVMMVAAGVRALRP